MSKNIILLGLPGVGKGTNAERIVQDFDLPHISTGDMFRKAMADNTELGLRAKEFMDSGNLVPDEITNGIVRERLDASDISESQGFLLDGYPRNTDQAKELDGYLQQKNQKIDLVIYIEASDQTAIERLSGRGRADDTPEVIENRIKVAKELTLPLVNYYQQENVLATIDGNHDIDTVYESVKSVINKL